MILLGMVPAAFASEGGGMGGHEEGIPWMAIGLHAVNFAIIFGFLWWALAPKLKDFLANRAATVKKEIDDSNAARKDAQDKFKELEARLGGFEKQLATMRADAEVEAEREAAAIEARAEVDARAVREGAERAIRDETARARTQLRKDAVELAVKLAEDRLRTDVDAAAEERLAGEFLDAVKDGHTGGRN